MKLTVLGGAAAGGNPGQGCAGYYVETDAARLVLDLGPGTLQELRRHTDYRTLDAVVISHLHLDHVLDLGALRFALAYNPVPPPGKIPLWLPPGGLAVVRQFGQAFHEEREGPDFFASVFDLAEYDPAQPLRINDAVLTFHPTVHYVPCWAMRVSTGAGGDLTYTADAGPASNLAPFAAGSALLVSEATLLEPTAEPYETRGHMTAAEAAEIARDAEAGKLLLAHMWAELGFASYAAEAARVFPGAVELAEPGLSVTW